MRSKDELKELEGYFKKVNLNFSIWVLIKILDRFESEVEIFLKENIDSNKSIFQISIGIIKDCEDLDQIRSKALLLLFDLNIEFKTKLQFLKELVHEQPDASLMRSLNAIKKDKRLADFIFYNINQDGKILKYRENPQDLESLLVEKNNKTIFYKHELLSFYYNNTPILVNLYLTDKYVRKRRFESNFNKFFKSLNSIKKESKTIIGKNVENNAFIEWLYTYTEKNIINNNELTLNINYTPHTLEERKNLLLHQLDVWSELDKERYAIALNKIQSNWHKKNHDDRKRNKKF